VRRGLFGTVWRVLLVVTAILLPMVIGFVRFANNLPTPTADTVKTDAIVVLTGGSDRISAGLALLEQGKAQRLFVSGVHRGVGVAELLKIDRTVAGTAAADPALGARIDLGDTAGDTFGNSVESAEWMRLNHFRSMRLVTADYHMRRALIEFRMAAPELEIVPNPVQPSPAIASGEWWRERAAFNLLVAEYGKYLVVKWRYQFAQLLA
jgi:uncharacterized SAM-binding protein YcdF (DUF218 family)